MVTRTQIHKLLKELPDDELPAVELFIEFLKTRDRMLLTLAAAPWEDEIITEEEEAAVREAKEDVAAGRLTPHEEVRRRLLGTP